MSLQDAKLAEIARKRAGIGPAREQQGAQITSIPSAAWAADDDGIDTGAAVIANVIIVTAGGDATWTLYGRSDGQTGLVEELDGYVDVTTPADTRRKYRVVCESEEELFVRVTAGGATTVDVYIEPCNG